MPLVGHFACQPVKSSSNISAKTVKKIKWSNSLTPIYVENVISLLETKDIKEYFPENVNMHIDVNGATDCITKICFRATECMLHIPRSGKANHRLKWYDTECCTKKANKTVYTNFRRTYKQLVKKKKSDFFSSITTEINSTMNNSTQFWKLTIQLTPSNRVLNNIDTNKWYAYFSTLFNQIQIWLATIKVT